VFNSLLIRRPEQEETLRPGHMPPGEMRTNPLRRVSQPTYLLISGH
jgi:hypothetical protein